MPAKKKTAASRSPSEILKLRVTLLDTRPPVWREIVVRADDSLESLMYAVMRAMGWGNCHLHELACSKGRYQVPEMIMDDGWGEPCGDASTVTIKEVLGRKGAKCRWTYDFGDSWEHEIRVIETGVDWSGKLPACTDGARACPPEDCGGIPGYWDLCEAMADPKHPERENLLEWLGEPFDPEAFDLAAANGRLSIQL